MTTANTTPAHLARAAMEGVTLGMAYGLRRMESLGVKPRVIHLTGGGSQSKVWRQICADAFGLPVVAMQTVEGAALGAAVQALATARPGVGPEVFTRHCVQIDTTSEVVPCNTTVYSEALSRQDAVARTGFWLLMSDTV